MVKEVQKVKHFKMCVHTYVLRYIHRYALLVRLCLVIAKSAYYARYVF
jgi:hypothetical protein